MCKQTTNNNFTLFLFVIVHLLIMRPSTHTHCDENSNQSADHSQCECDINKSKTATRSPRLLQSPYGYVSFRQLTVMKIVDRFSVYVSGLHPRIASIVTLSSEQWYVDQIPLSLISIDLYRNQLDTT